MDLPSSRALRKEFVDLAVVPVVSVIKDGYDGMKYRKKLRIGVLVYYFVPIVLSIALRYVVLFPDSVAVPIVLPEKTRLAVEYDFIQDYLFPGLIIGKCDKKRKKSLKNTKRKSIFPTNHLKGETLWRVFSTTTIFQVSLPTRMMLFLARWQETTPLT